MSEWQLATAKAVKSALELEVPFAIQGSFKSKSIEAKAWKIQLEQGASVNITVQWLASDSSKLLVDILMGQELKELKSYLADNDSVRFEAVETSSYFVQIQPELLGEGNFQVTINGTSTYAVFPVQGKDSRAIQSVWGDVRDGGKRSHEGVDIFADRGTPVLAPVAGVVTAIRDTGLGGKQVWLRDPERDWNLYFAHLDSQLVRNLQRVKPGDTLGLVGNTGNAKTTSPHLHFGIYQSGAINPFPIIRTQFKIAPYLPNRQFPQVMQIQSKRASLRTQPFANSSAAIQLKVGTPVRIGSATLDWFEVTTPEGDKGFLYKNQLSYMDSSALESRLAYAFTSLPPGASDSLLVDLSEFSKVGTTQKDYIMIIDKDDNIFYLPKALKK